MLLLCGKGKPGASMGQREEGIGGEDSSLWGELASPEKQGRIHESVQPEQPCLLLLYASSPAKTTKGTGMTKRYLSLLGGNNSLQNTAYILTKAPSRSKVLKFSSF